MRERIRHSGEYGPKSFPIPEEGKPVSTPENPDSIEQKMNESLNQAEGGGLQATPVPPTAAPAPAPSAPTPPVAAPAPPVAAAPTPPVSVPGGPTPVQVGNIAAALDPSAHRTGCSAGRSERCI